MNPNGLFLVGLSQLVLEGYHLGNALGFESRLHRADVVDALMEQRRGFVALGLGWFREYFHRWVLNIRNR